MERDKHLIKDCSLRVLLRASLMNCLQQDARANGRNLLLTDGAAVEVPKTIRRILKDEERATLMTQIQSQTKKVIPQRKKPSPT